MYVHDDVLDAAHAEFAEATTMYVCSAQPANQAGIAAVALADIAMTPGLGNGDYSIANGDVSGRKVTVAAQNAIPIDASGNASHLAYSDGTRLLRVTDLAATQALTSGGTVSVPAHDVEIADPVAA